MKRSLEQGPQGFPAQGLLSSWNWGAPPSQHVDVFGNPEAHQISLLRILVQLDWQPCIPVSQRSACGAKSSNLLITWSFWGSDAS